MAARSSGIGGTQLDVHPLDGVDRRRAGRIGAKIRASVRLADLDGPRHSRARVLDISDVGVRVRTRRKFPVDARVLVDMECVLPLRVHLGYDAHSLVVDGPMHTHLVRIAGVVTRLTPLPGRQYEVGIEFCEDTTRFDELQLVQFYVDHLRERDTWAF
jgi:hypothetical protein